MLHVDTIFILNKAKFRYNEVNKKYMAEKEESVAASAQPQPKTQPSVATKSTKPTGPKIPTLDELKVLIKQAAGGLEHDAAIQLFNGIMAYAHGSRASDVHIEPGGEGAIVRVRVDGILHDQLEVPLPVHEQMIAVLKILTSLRTDEHRAPQDGRYEYVTEKGEVDVRVSILPVTNGEKAVLRLLSAESHSLSLEQLGFAEDDLEKVKRAIAKPWGMILATGPTGSGKTTTVYAILQILNQREVNIATIEDPVEFDIEGVNQSQVDSAAKLTFAKGLRSVVRQDPDIIMVGEIRDEETAKIAVNAALTGHKLLSTLHTNNAASTMPRLIDMEVEPFLVSSTLLIAIAQRLVRRVCEKCSGKKMVTRAEMEVSFKKDILELLFEGGDGVEVPEAKGCAACGNTGYKGRVGIYEILENSPSIQEMISRSADAATIQDESAREGMTTIVQDGIRKIKSGITTIEELLRVMQE